jgi:hypothetical protein
VSEATGSAAKEQVGSVRLTLGSSVRYDGSSDGLRQVYDLHPKGTVILCPSIAGSSTSSESLQTARTKAMTCWLIRRTGETTVPGSDRGITSDDILLLEERYVSIGRPNERPLPFAHSIVVRAKPPASSDQILVRIRYAWSAVARWGRWSDEESGAWPDREACLERLPQWLGEALRKLPTYEVDNWLQDLHDRSWIWWSSATQGDLVKIDLQTDALPLTAWPLRLVGELSGAAVLYDGDWIGSSALAALAEGLPPSHV